MSGTTYGLARLQRILRAQEGRRRSRCVPCVGVHSNVGSAAFNLAMPTSALGVRREKAALSSGCKSHPVTAPAGSNRSSHGGDEMAEAFG